MPKKRSCHFSEENFKYVEDYFKSQGYASFNTALNVIIEQHRANQPHRDRIKVDLIKTIHELKFKKEELYKE